MATVRLGVIGLGIMGSAHADRVAQGLVPGLELAAVAHSNPERMVRWPGAKPFRSAEELIDSGQVDAVLVATPHFAHRAAGIDALKRGLHVMMEKPVCAHLAHAEELIQARQSSAQVFGVMFQTRTDPHLIAIRDWVRSGRLGRIQRIAWTATDWFRTEQYYRSASWRGTWAGEGGGVLLNQCPHNLDFWQWTFGMPKQVLAFCRFGRHHDIEVEDEVHGYFEYADGTSGSFIASTGESPGTNRLEIVGELGRLVYEDRRLRVAENQVSIMEFSRTASEPFNRPPCQEREIALPAGQASYESMLSNFVDAIVTGAPLIAPAEEGLKSLELANAMVLSSWLRRTISLPMDPVAYAKQLEARFTSRRNAAKMCSASAWLVTG
jgi:predicted dehydrogenase